MANGDTDICVHFVNGDVPNTRWFNAVRGDNNGGWAASVSHGFYASRGTYRLSYKDESGVATRHASSLWSYERFCLAARFTQRKDETMLIVNADNGPTHTTRQHQRELRDALKRTGARHAFLPFSALRAAGIPHVARDILVIATTEDREVKREVRRRSAATGEMETHEVKEHFLGETLFMSGGRYYISGLDRNDDPRRRNFYLARLFDMRRGPRTVDEALNMLRPNQVPEGALRQGEWFLVPASNIPVKGSTVQSHPDGIAQTKGVPLLSASAEEMKRALLPGSYTFRGRHSRHAATRMAFFNNEVYVSGMLRDSSHGPLKLGNGKTWFRVYRNLADGSWNASGDVD